MVSMLFRSLTNNIHDITTLCETPPVAIWRQRTQHQAIRPHIYKSEILIHQLRIAMNMIMGSTGLLVVAAVLLAYSNAAVVVS